MNSWSVTSSPVIPGTLRALAVALAACLSLAACGDDSADGGAGGGASEGAGAGTPGCGTASDPTLLTLRDVSPVPGSTVAGDAVVHAFTIVDAPGLIQQLTFQLPAAHTAGTPDPAQLAFTITQDGADLVYTAAPVAWSTVPAHVELSVTGAFEADGCVYAFPSPLFSYDVEPGEGAGGAGGGGEGGSGEGGAAGEGGAGGAG